MEFELMPEDDPAFLTVARSTPQKSPEIPSCINTVSLSIKRLTSMSTSLNIFRPSSLTARPVISFEFNDAHRPRNIIPQCFTTCSRKWSVLVQIDKNEQISLFLCERGAKEIANKFEPLLYTSALFEIGIDDPGLKKTVRTSSQPQYSSGFYSFPNEHFHIVGERNYCKVSSLENPYHIKLDACITETSIHIGIMHHISLFEV